MDLYERMGEGSSVRGDTVIGDGFEELEEDSGDSGGNPRKLLRAGVDWEVKEFG